MVWNSEGWSVSHRKNDPGKIDLGDSFFQAKMFWGIKIFDPPDHFYHEKLILELNPKESWSNHAEPNPSPPLPSGSEPKNHGRENLRRIREIQSKARERREGASKPVKPVIRNDKYMYQHVQAKVVVHTQVRVGEGVG